MYSKITNPKTGRRVSVKSRLGKTILRNYLFILSGGASRRTRRKKKEMNEVREMGLHDSDALDNLAARLAALRGMSEGPAEDIVYNEDGPIEEDIGYNDLLARFDELIEVDGGERIAGLFTDGVYYPGTIQSQNPDGTYHIIFDDGDEQTNFRAIYVKPIAFLQLKEDAITTADLSHFRRTVPGGKKIALHNQLKKSLFRHRRHVDSDGGASEHPAPGLSTVTDLGLLGPLTDIMAFAEISEDIPSFHDIEDLITETLGIDIRDTHRQKITKLILTELVKLGKIHKGDIINTGSSLRSRPEYGLIILTGKEELPHNTIIIDTDRIYIQYIGEEIIYDINGEIGRPGPGVDEEFITQVKERLEEYYSLDTEFYDMALKNVLYFLNTDIPESAAVREKVQISLTADELIQIQDTISEKLPILIEQEQLEMLEMLER